MKFSNIEQLRVWAALTGIVLVIAWFALFLTGRGDNQPTVLLAGGVAGFEFFFFAQDLTRRLRGDHG